ncbi:MAG TPA: PQQ-binding-like beta-propeller repeat protein, partial [Candidatus Acidoferrales bacterium]|nr:PQQ-binding-like beta-propeller repeat protein [Candidatus Acidoferrales bacterium]
MDKVNKAIICLALVLLFLAPIMVSAQPQSNNEWPMFQRDVTHTGSTDAVAPMTNNILWKFNTGGQVGSPTVVDGVVYVGSYDHKLYAFNAQNGSLIWAAETGDIIISKPAVAEGIVCVGSEDYNLYAFDTATGSKLWSFATGYYVDSDPAIIDGVVYFGSEDSKVYALS